MIDSVFPEQAEQKFDRLSSTIRSYLPSINMNRVQQAFHFAQEAHKGQVRYSGEPYILHPLGALENLIFLKPDEDAIIATLLHDVPEDTDRTLDDIEKCFGKEVARLTTGLKKLKLLHSRHTMEGQMENLRKLFLAMAQDLRVVLIKLADRLHNMQTLQYVPAEKQKRIALETMEIYSPIASRLGIHEMKWRLEDLAFCYLEPEAFQDITQQFSKHAALRKEHIRHAKHELESCLERERIEGIVEGRAKHLYSIYRKMKKKGRSSLDEIFDLFAMRIILPDRFRQDGEPDYTQCYSVLGCIHNLWIPLVSRFKDYISVPKVNGYQSLHTTVMGLSLKHNDQPIEIQIRTDRMHRNAEYGVAAHWWYKDSEGELVTTTSDKDLQKHHLRGKTEWIHSLAQLQQEIQNNSELAESLRVDIFRDRIFVITPRGDVKDLPVGATPVDFAYAVHSEIGHRCHAAKVNGVITPLDSELSNGQVVEIITKKNPSPSRYWLSFVKTNFAKERIKEWYRNLDRDKSIQEGKNFFNQYLQRLGRPMLDASLSLLKLFGDRKARERTLEHIGRGSVTPASILRKIFPNDEEFLTPVSVHRNVRDIRLKLHPSKYLRVLIGGEKNLPHKFSPCCRPAHDDAIVGYVTRGRGVTIHRVGCKMLRRYAHRRERFVNAFWVRPDDEKNLHHNIKLSVFVEDRLGALRDLSAAISARGINILNIHSAPGDYTSDVQGVIIEFFLSIVDYEQYERLLDSLEQLPGVLSLNNVPVLRAQDAS